MTLIKAVVVFLEIYSPFMYFELLNLKIFEQIRTVTHVTKIRSHTSRYILSHNCKTNGLREIRKVNATRGTSHTPVNLCFDVYIPHNSQSFECETHDPHFSISCGHTRHAHIINYITTPKYTCLQLCLFILIKQHIWLSLGHKSPPFAHK